MGNINAPISYTWRFGWSSKEEPKVNPLIKAILERNVGEMERLFGLGASIEEADPCTLQRTLYFVVDDYSVMKCLVDHGFSIIENFARYATGETSQKLSTECVSPEGYVSGLAGKAYFLGAYDVMELLVGQGFDAFYCFEKGWKKARKADEEIFEARDAQGIRILQENGYSVPGDYYEESVLKRPQVKRKSIGLDSKKFSMTPRTCWQENVPLLFGRSDAINRNRRRNEDHQDWLRAYNQLKNDLGEARFRACQDQEKRDKDSLSQTLKLLLSRM